MQEVLLWIFHLSSSKWPCLRARAGQARLQVQNQKSGFQRPTLSKQGGDELCRGSPLNDFWICRDNTDFLPVAYVAGLQPGIPVTLPITVVAEDGVTSLSYYVQIQREVAPDSSSGNASDLLSGLLGDSPASSPSSGLDSSSIFMSSNPQLATPPPPSFEKSQLQEGGSMFGLCLSAQFLWP